MWCVSLLLLALLLVTVTHYWVFKWRNPKCSGKLPPGSMGLPLIGETIQFFIPSKSIDMPSFIKSRMRKYGPLFKTSLAGRPVVLSSDADFNYFILQQEGKLVEFWYMDSFAELMGQNDVFREGIVAGIIYKSLKRSIGQYFGNERLKGILLPELEDVVNHALDAWTTQKSVEVKNACSRMILNYTSKLLFSYDPAKSSTHLSEILASFMQGLMSFPLNLPGTTFHRSLQNQKKILKTIREAVEKRKATADPPTGGGDFLDCLVNYMKTENLLTETLITYTIFALLIATSETIPTTLAVAIKYLAEDPLAMQELLKENDDIVKRKESKERGMTWKDYKSMTFTMQVINESLRMTGSAGILRRATQDIHISGYTIPKDWTIAVIPAALHMNPDIYKDPVTFNPWRWKDLGENIKAKYFIPFSGGMRTCPGADFSKVFMAIFLHHFVTKYRWTTVRAAEIVRNPMISFGKGHHIKISRRTEMTLQGMEGQH